MSFIPRLTPASLLIVISLVAVSQSRLKSPFAPINISSAEIDNVSPEISASKTRLNTCSDGPPDTANAKFSSAHENAISPSSKPRSNCPPTVIPSPFIMN